MSARVCPDCARRTWLLERLAGHLDPVRDRIAELLELDDGALVAAVGGAHREAIEDDLQRWNGAGLDARAERAGIEAACRCDPSYPAALRELASPPAVLHVAGGVDRLARSLEEPSVALVGSRRPSSYGLETTRRLAGDLAGAGLTVVSGLALGVDAAAHQGALDARGMTLAVLPGGADVAYPARHRRLLARIREAGIAVSELGPGVAPRRWMFPARNRLIAALAEVTVLIQGRERSGALLTADWAVRLGRGIGAVPGQAAAPLSAAPHRLLREGARLIASAQDVLDAVYGVGAVLAPQRRTERLEPSLAALMEAIAEGEEGRAAFARAGLAGESGMAALAQLELAGLVWRGPGGRYLAR